MTASRKTSAKSEDGFHAVLPLRDIVVFPNMIVPLFVGREKSIKALEEVMGADKQIMLVTPMTSLQLTRYTRSGRWQMCSSC